MLQLQRCKLSTHTRLFLPLVNHFLGRYVLKMNHQTKNEFDYSATWLCDGVCDQCKAQLAHSSLRGPWQCALIISSEDSWRAWRHQHEVFPGAGAGRDEGPPRYHKRRRTVERINRRNKTLRWDFESVLTTDRFENRSAMNKKVTGV